MEGKEAQAGRYRQVIERVFASGYRSGCKSVPFTRDDLITAAQALGLKAVKNLGDLIYTFRFRQLMPSAIQKTAKKGHVWIIRLAGAAKYRFSMVPETVAFTTPRSDVVPTKIPDSTPGLIARYALDDEQAILAILRYNRLIDTLLGITCYSIQSHLRTQVKDLGQTETDEVYVAVDRRGDHYVVPVQAKGGRDRIGIVQIEQDIAMCAARFPGLKCVPVAAQFLGAREDRVVALFAFEQSGQEIGVLQERHYKLVPKSDLTSEELAQYAARPEAF